MAQRALHNDFEMPTFTTSYIATQQTSNIPSSNTQTWTSDDGGGGYQYPYPEQHKSPWRDDGDTRHFAGLGSTGKGILIGMLSAFGSAAFVALIIALVYFFRYTNRGRIFLDRIGRPGEFDDEQQFQREEEEAMAEMDELQKAEYLRAKGTYT